LKSEAKLIIFIYSFNRVLPGGKAELKEMLKTSALRELEEEVGISVKSKF
jgi:8-oxo-dGTP pyrophosphatase MutT (NUDIX family)